MESNECLVLNDGTTGCYVASAGVCCFRAHRRSRYHAVTVDCVRALKTRHGLEVLVPVILLWISKYYLVLWLHSVRSLGEIRTTLRGGSLESWFDEDRS